MSKGRKTGTDTPHCGEEYQKASALVKDKFCSKRALGCLFYPFLWTSKEMEKGLNKDPESSSG